MLNVTQIAKITQFFGMNRFKRQSLMTSYSEIRKAGHYYEMARNRKQSLPDSFIAHSLTHVYVPKEPETRKLRNATEDQRRSEKTAGRAAYQRTSARGKEQRLLRSGKEKLSAVKSPQPPNGKSAAPKAPKIVSHANARIQQKSHNRDLRGECCQRKIELTAPDSGADMHIPGK